MSEVVSRAPSSQEKESSFIIFLRRLFRTRELGVLVVLVILCVIMTFLSPYFLTR
jgi:hypothetical protein